MRPKLIRVSETLDGVYIYFNDKPVKVDISADGKELVLSVVYRDFNSINVTTIDKRKRNKPWLASRKGNNFLDHVYKKAGL